MSERYIFQIEHLTKLYDRRSPKDVWLAFYPSAKIGVLGSNGLKEHAPADHGA